MLQTEKGSARICIALAAGILATAGAHAAEFGRFNFKKVAVVRPEEAALDVAAVTAKLPAGLRPPEGSNAVVVRIEVAPSKKAVAETREFVRQVKREQGQDSKDIEVVINPGTEFALQAGSAVGGGIPPVAARSGSGEWSLAKESGKGKPKLLGFAFKVSDSEQLDLLFFAPRDAGRLTFIHIDGTNKRHLVQVLGEK